MTLVEIYLLVASRSIALIGAFGLAMSLTGCAKATKLADCSKLTSATTPHMRAVQAAILKMNSESEASTASVKAVGSAMEKLADVVKELGLKDEKLKSLAKEYEATYREGAQAAKDLATAIDKQDAAAAEKTSKTLQMVETKESNLVDALNAYCRS